MWTPVVRRKKSFQSQKVCFKYLQEISFQKDFDFHHFIVLSENLIDLFGQMSSVDQLISSQLTNHQTLLKLYQLRKTNIDLKNNYLRILNDS